MAYVRQIFFVFVTVVLPVSEGLALQYNRLHRMNTRVRRLSLSFFYMRVVVSTLARKIS